MEPKQVKKAKMAGALTWSVIEGSMEAFAFPSLYSLPPPYDVVPPLDKGLVPLSGAAIMAVAKKPKTVMFGQGAALYGMGAFVNELSRRVLLRNLGQFRVRAAGSRASFGMAGNGGRYGKTVTLQPRSVVRWTYPPR